MKVHSGRQDSDGCGRKQVIIDVDPLDEPIGIIDLGCDASTIHKVRIEHVELNSIDETAETGQDQFDLIVYNFA